MLLTLFAPQATPPASTTKVWIRIGGVWKETTVHLRVGGVWKTTTPAIKISGVWK